MRSHTWVPCGMEPPAKQEPEAHAVLVHWDKKAANYLGLLKLACVLLWLRRLRRLRGP
jgi:hypothetical protein